MMGGHLPANLMHFARLLRRAGLPLGPADLIAAAEAMACVDLGRRDEVRAALRATLVHRHEHQSLFDQAFLLFWRDPEAARQAAAMAALASILSAKPARAQAGARRLAEAMQAQKPRAPQPEPPRRSVDAAWTASERERLQTMDFEAMSAAEIAAAAAAMHHLALPLDDRRTRRWRPDPEGPRADLRRTIRRSLRQGGEIAELARARRTTRPPPLVVLCDISGSMARYAQLLLHFFHALTNGRERVAVFLFGTRLTNITRQLRHRDPEAAFAEIARAVPDWSGGTRIGETLAAFNRIWGRRVLGQGAVVLLITDGLDRDGAAGLAENMARLRRSARRLVWLNPLLRWEGFAPKSQSIRAMLPHVDEFRPVHNLASVRALVASLSRPVSPRGMERWR